MFVPKIFLVKSLACQNNRRIVLGELSIHVNIINTMHIYTGLYATPLNSKIFITNKHNLRIDWKFGNISSVSTGLCHKIIKFARIPKWTFNPLNPDLYTHCCTGDPD